MFYNLTNFVFNSRDQSVLQLSLNITFDVGNIIFFYLITETAYLDEGMKGLYLFTYEMLRTLGLLFNEYKKTSAQTTFAIA